MSNSVRIQWSRLAIGILLTPPLAGVCMPTYAQSGVLEEVVVVARKREESLQDTPVAVSAFNTDQLREAQITNVADLAQQVPGLSNKDGDKVSGLTIRGVGARAVRRVRWLVSSIFQVAHLCQQRCLESPRCMHVPGQTVVPG